MVEHVEIAVPPSLTQSKISALLDALSGATDSVVVLHGASEDVFCLGMDLSATEGGSIPEGLALYKHLLLTLATRANPTIAVVDGATVGGGVGIMAVCDLCIATDAARISLPEALYGFAPAMVAEVLQNRIPAQTGYLMALRGESITAREGHRVGLVDMISDRGALDKDLRRQLRMLARTRAGYPAVKRVFRDTQSLEPRLDAALAQTAAFLAEPSTQHRIAAMENGEAPWLTP